MLEQQRIGKAVQSLMLHTLTYLYPACSPKCRVENRELERVRQIIDMEPNWLAEGDLLLPKSFISPHSHCCYIRARMGQWDTWELQGGTHVSVKRTPSPPAPLLESPARAPQGTRRQHVPAEGSDQNLCERSEVQQMVLHARAVQTTGRYVGSLIAGHITESSISRAGS